MPSPHSSQTRVHTPTVLQAQGTECGLAALAIVLGYFGQHVTLQELRERSGISRDGSSAAWLAKLARAYGLEVKSLRREMEALENVSVPAIAHCRFNHFVVIEEVRPGMIVINDPVSGPCGVPRADFGEDFTGIVMSFQPGPSFEQKAPGFGFFPALLEAVSPVRNGIAVATLAAMLAAPAMWFLASGELLDGALAMGFAVGFSRYRMGRLRTRLASTESAALMRRIGKLPAGYFSYRWPASVAWLAEAPAAVADIVCGEPGIAVLECVAMLPVVVLLAATSPVSAVICLVAMVACSLAAVLLYGRRDGRYRKFVREGQGGAGIDAWRLSQIERIKLGTGPEETFSAVAGAMVVPFNASRRFAKGHGMEGALQMALPPLTALLAAQLAGWIPGLLAGWCVYRFAALPAHWPSVDKLRRSLQMQWDVKQITGRAKSLPSGESLVVTGLTFGYNPRAKALLSNVSFRAEHGTVLGLAGVPGSGRTTLARLICGLLDPWQGEVTVPGSTVMLDRQSPFFEGSLWENLTLWDTSLEPEDVERAVDDACLREVVSDRTAGFATRVELGAANFSGGQRQRLALARALAREPKLLILDEAMDALDPELEGRVIANLRRRGCTCIVISLRPSTLALCDEVLVLQEGTIAERGHAQDLLAKGGAYGKLTGELVVYE